MMIQVTVFVDFFPAHSNQDKLILLVVGNQALVESKLTCPGICHACLCFPPACGNSSRCCHPMSLTALSKVKLFSLPI